MKKTISMFLMALLGGAVALGGYKVIFPDRGAVVDSQSVPVYQTSNSGVKQIIAPDFGAAAEQTVNAVVHIRTYYDRKSSIYDDFFGLYEFFGQGSPYQNMPVEASGSGVIISADGYIVTNNHVVQEANKIEVVLNDKRTFTATTVGTDPSTDLALLKISVDDLPFLNYGNSDDLRIGEWVLAVGNPFNLTSTVTAGIVSAKARNLNILGSQSSIESFIQTDAAVNRGNSGGALVNTKGELVGINAAIASNTGAYAGYSFAIPVNIVKKVVKDLLEFGTVQRAYIGVSIQELDSKLASERNLKNVKGVYVAGLSANGAAEEAGIKEGDVITRINGAEVNSTSQLLESIGLHRPGDIIEVTVNRDSKTIVYKVKLRNKDNNFDKVAPEEEATVTSLGATLIQPTSDELRKLNIKSGVKVSSLQNGKLKSAGIREGFIITRIDKQEVSSLDDIQRILNGKKGGVLIEGIYPNGMRAYYGFGL
jgi:serine protease Do